MFRLLMYLFVMCGQTEGVSCSGHWDSGAISRITFPVQRADSATGEERCDGDWTTAAASVTTTSTSDANTMDCPSAVLCLQQSRRAQLHRSVAGQSVVIYGC